MVFLAFFAFAGILFWAFSTARPLFKKRGEVYGDVTGRLTEGFSGIRIVKAYTAEEHEEKVFDEGAQEAAQPHRRHDARRSPPPAR